MILQSNNERNNRKAFANRANGPLAGRLILVFVGVYPAFWLSNYQQHQQEIRHHDQILAVLENQLREGIEAAKTESAREDPIVAEFDRALAAGEMPPLRPFAFVTDYSATDIATLLQSGGIELLDVKTLLAVRNLESVIRGGINRMSYFEKLSNELIAPNVDQDISFFYDPATKKLRKRFEKYPDGLHAAAQFFHDLEHGQDMLLKQIQAERERH